MAKSSRFDGGASKSSTKKASKGGASSRKSGASAARKSGASASVVGRAVSSSASAASAAPKFQAKAKPKAKTKISFIKVEFESSALDLVDKSSAHYKFVQKVGSKEDFCNQDFGESVEVFDEGVTKSASELDRVEWIRFFMSSKMIIERERRVHLWGVENFTKESEAWREERAKEWDADKDKIGKEYFIRKQQEYPLVFLVRKSPSNGFDTNNSPSKAVSAGNGNGDNARKQNEDWGKWFSEVGGRSVGRVKKKRASQQSRDESGASASGDAANGGDITVKVEGHAVDYVFDAEKLKESWLNEEWKRWQIKVESILYSVRKTRVKDRQALTFRGYIHPDKKGRSKEVDIYENSLKKRAAEAESFISLLQGNNNASLNESALIRNAVTRFNDIYYQMKNDRRFFYMVKSYDREFVAGEEKEAMEACQDVIYALSKSLKMTPLEIACEKIYAEIFYGRDLDEIEYDFEKYVDNIVEIIGDEELIYSQRVKEHADAYTTFDFDEYTKSEEYSDALEKVSSYDSELFDEYLLKLENAFYIDSKDEKIWDHRIVNSLYNKIISDPNLKIILPSYFISKIDEGSVNDVVVNLKDVLINLQKYCQPQIDGVGEHDFISKEDLKREIAGAKAAGRSKFAIALDLVAGYPKSKYDKFSALLTEFEDVVNNPKANKAKPFCKLCNEIKNDVNLAIIFDQYPSDILGNGSDPLMKKMCGEIRTMLDLLKSYSNGDSPEVKLKAKKEIANIKRKRVIKKKNKEYGPEFYEKFIAEVFLQVIRRCKRDFANASPAEVKNYILAELRLFEAQLYKEDNKNIFEGENSGGQGLLIKKLEDALKTKKNMRIKDRIELSMYEEMLFRILVISKQCEAAAKNGVGGIKYPLMKPSIYPFESGFVNSGAFFENLNVEDAAIKQEVREAVRSVFCDEEGRVHLVLSRDQYRALSRIDKAVFEIKTRGESTGEELIAIYKAGREDVGEDDKGLVRLRADIDNKKDNPTGAREVKIIIPTAGGKTYLADKIKSCYETLRVFSEVISIDHNSSESEIRRLINIAQGREGVSRDRFPKGLMVNLDERFFYGLQFLELFCGIRGKSYENLDRQELIKVEKKIEEINRALRMKGILTVIWGASASLAKLHTATLRVDLKLLHLEQREFELKNKLEEEYAYYENVILVSEGVNRLYERYVTKGALIKGDNFVEMQMLSMVDELIESIGHVKGFEDLEREFLSCRDLCSGHSLKDGIVKLKELLSTLFSDKEGDLYKLRFLQKSQVETKRKLVYYKELERSTKQSTTVWTRNRIERSGFVHQEPVSSGGEETLDKALSSFGSRLSDAQRAQAIIDFDLNYADDKKLKSELVKVSNLTGAQTIIIPCFYEEGGRRLVGVRIFKAGLDGQASISEVIKSASKPTLIDNKLKELDAEKSTILSIFTGNFEGASVGPATFIGGDYGMASTGIAKVYVRAKNPKSLTWNQIAQFNRDRDYHPNGYGEGIEYIFAHCGEASMNKDDFLRGVDELSKRRDEEIRDAYLMAKVNRDGEDVTFDDFKKWFIDGGFSEDGFGLDYRSSLALNGFFEEKQAPGRQEKTKFERYRDWLLMHPEDFEDFLRRKRAHMEDLNLTGFEPPKPETKIPASEPESETTASESAKYKPEIEKEPKSVSPEPEPTLSEDRLRQLVSLIQSIQPFLAIYEGARKENKKALSVVEQGGTSQIHSILQAIKDMGWSDIDDDMKRHLAIFNCQDYSGLIKFHKVLQNRGVLNGGDDDTLAEQKLQEAKKNIDNCKSAIIEKDLEPKIISRFYHTREIHSINPGFVGNKDINSATASLSPTSQGTDLSGSSGTISPSAAASVSSAAAVNGSAEKGGGRGRGGDGKGDSHS